MRHRTHLDRTVAGTARVLVGTGAGSEVRAAGKSSASEWSL